MSDEMQEILNDFLTESNEMLEVLDQRFVTPLSRGTPDEFFEIWTTVVNTLQSEKTPAI